MLRSLTYMIQSTYMYDPVDHYFHGLVSLYTILIKAPVGHIRNLSVLRGVGDSSEHGGSALKLD